MGFVLSFGRICNPPVLGVGICNPVSKYSHYKCVNPILPDYKSGRTGGRYRMKRFTNPAEQVTRFPSPRRGGVRGGVCTSVRADLQSARIGCRDLQSCKQVFALQMRKPNPAGLQIRQNRRQIPDDAACKSGRTGGVVMCTMLFPRKTTTQFSSSAWRKSRCRLQGIPMLRGVSVNTARSIALNSMKCSPFLHAEKWQKLC